MAHVTAAKVTAKQSGNVRGKRRGIKAFGGTKVKVGAILVRQLGTKIIAGKNVGMGRDYTLYAKADGVVTYSNATSYKRGKKIVNVLPRVVETKSTPKRSKQA